MMKISAKQKKFVKGKVSYFSGTGRRKTAIARVRIIKGTGDIIINSQNLSDFFNSIYLIHKIKEPLKLTGFEKKVDISILSSGGGKSSIGEASRLGISRALIKMDPNLRTTLKKSGFLTRDSREKRAQKTRPQKSSSGTSMAEKIKFGLKIYYKKTL